MAVCTCTGLLLQLSLLLIIVLNCGSDELKYKQFNQGLSDVPTDIPMNVTQIELVMNDLTAIPAYQFAGYSDLVYLNLYDNDISIFDESALEGTVVERLQLTLNNLRGIPDLRAINATLKELHMRSNVINTIPLDFLQHYGTLEILSLGWNLLTQIPILPPQQTAFLSLGVQANPIENITQFALNRLQASGLQHLLITEYGTVLEQIQPYVVSSLTQLYIERCPVEVPILNMEHFPLLNWLSILDNFYLTQIPDVSILNETLQTLEVLRNSFDDPPRKWLADMLSKLTKLRRLTVDNHVFTLIDLTQTNPELTGFTLRSIPLVCNCSTAWMKRVQMNATSTLTITTDSNQICHGPGNLTGADWNDLTLNDFSECPIINTTGTITTTTTTDTIDTTTTTADTTDAATKTDPNLLNNTTVMVTFPSLSSRTTDTTTTNEYEVQGER